MAINESKKTDSRQWRKWKDAGAVGDDLTAETLPIKRTKLPVVATCESIDFTTLNIGLRRENDSSVPVVSVVIPERAQNFPLGRLVNAKDLPEGTRTTKAFFRKKSRDGK